MENIIRKVYIVVCRVHDLTFNIDLNDIQGVYESKEDAQKWIYYTDNRYKSKIGPNYYEIVERKVIWRSDLSPKEFLLRDKEAN